MIEKKLIIELIEKDTNKHKNLINRCKTDFTKNYHLNMVERNIKTLKFIENNIFNRIVKSTIKSIIHDKYTFYVNKINKISIKFYNKSINKKELENLKILEKEKTFYYNLYEYYYNKNI